MAVGEFQHILDTQNDTWDVPRLTYYLHRFRGLLYGWHRSYQIVDTHTFYYTKYIQDTRKCLLYYEYMCTVLIMCPMKY